MFVTTCRQTRKYGSKDNVISKHENRSIQEWGNLQSSQAIKPNRIAITTKEARKQRCKIVKQVSKNAGRQASRLQQCCNQEKEKQESKELRMQQMQQGHW